MNSKYSKRFLRVMLQSNGHMGKSDSYLIVRESLARWMECKSPPPELSALGLRHFPVPSSEGSSCLRYKHV